LKDFFEDKTYPKLKLLEKLGYALGIVGNNEFFFGMTFHTLATK
jgi:hypothetical protein